MKRILALVLCLAACKSSPTNSSKPPSDLSLQRFGAYSPAQPRAMLLGVHKPLALFGHLGIDLQEPKLFGVPGVAKNANGYAIVAGLTVLNTDTGEARLLTAADGVPTMDYGELVQEDAGPATASFFDLAWITPDTAFAGAAWTTVVRGEVDASNHWTFKTATLRAPNATHDAHISYVTVAGGELFAGSEQGLAVLDPETLALKRWVDLGASAPAVFRLATGFVDGPVAVALLGDMTQPHPTAVHLVRPGEATSTPLTLPADLIPMMVAGLPEGLLVGGEQPDKRGVLYRVDWSSNHPLQLALVASADQLNHYSSDVKPFVPSRAAYDSVHGTLLVGSLLTSVQPDSAVGLLQFQTTDAGEILSAPAPVFARSDPYYAMMPWAVDQLAVDASGRWYVIGRQLCDETSARQLGLLRIEQDNGEKRLVRPLLSGVRSIAVDPAAGHTWLGLRNDNPGLSCDSYVTQQHICQLRADGSCQINPLKTNDADQPITPNVGAVAIAFGSSERKELAIATKKDATFVRRGDTTSVYSTQFDPGLSLWETSAAWSERGELWVGSEIEWEVQPPDDTSGADWSKVNDRGPHGLGYLDFGTPGQKTGNHRYVRIPADTKQGDIGGLPSNTVLDVLPLGGKQHALVALGVERMSRAYDHLRPDESPMHVMGGLAEVNGESITVIPAPAGVSWSDVVSLARASDGTLFATDAHAGLFRLDLTAHTATRWAAAAWPAEDRARAMAIDGHGQVAVATEQGLYLYDAQGKATALSTDGAHGQFWTVRFMADGVLYAGADQGLVRVVLPGATAPALGPTGVLPRDPWPLDYGCNGTDGCVCFGNDNCDFGLNCGCQTPTDCTCQGPQLDPCSTTPGAEKCACQQDSDCTNGLTCQCDTTGSCTCLSPPSGCGGTTGCTCQTDSDCARGYRCQSGIAGSSCVPN